MISSDLRRIIQSVLKPIGLYSADAEELLVLTAAVESKGGKYLYQIKGPARGIFQMEPRTEQCIIDNYLRYKEELDDKVKQYITGKNDLVTNLAYQIIMARIHYLRVPAPLPDRNDVEAMAKYWKQYYNTPKGKGTVEKAIGEYYEYAC